jgi:50S ribosomal protein L16 3-hydroxylase
MPLIKPTQFKPSVKPLNRLGDLSIEEFLRHYWQQQHAVLRGVFPNFEPPIDANELAGLALEDEVESRLIRETKPNQWTLASGPFSDETFAELPEENWTLLVQAVDQWNLGIWELLQQFSFIPNWRRDDVMISFAVPGGSVGPHYDHYDVFLIQAEGEREWMIGPRCDDLTERADNDQLDLLANIDAQETHVLQPGDVLYVPPGVAHWGVAKTAAMTISIGFRAPSVGEVFQDFGKELEGLLGNDTRFGDAKRQPSHCPGELAQQDVDRIQQLLATHVANPKIIASWFGSFMTEPKRDELLPLVDRVDVDGIYQACLVRDAVTRVAYYRSEDEFLWFCNGEVQSLNATCAVLAERLADEAVLSLEEVSALVDDESTREWMNELLEQGHYHLYE